MARERKSPNASGEPPEPQPELTESEQRTLEEEAKAGRAQPQAEADDWSVFKRVAAIVAELPAVGKVQRNTQQNFNFRGHDDVMNELNPLLSKYSVFMVPFVLDRVTDQRQTRQGSTLYEVNLLVQYTFYGPLGDSFCGSSWGEGTDSGDKATNKAMTMAFKNVIAQTFAVSTEETRKYDTDQHSDEETTGRASVRQHADVLRAKPPGTPSESLRRFDKLLGRDGEAQAWMEELIEKRFQATSLHDLTSEQRVLAWTGFNAALMYLEDEAGDLALQQGVRGIIVAAFAMKNQGLLLEGPAWALDGPEEEAGRPSFADYHKPTAIETEA